jgi:hypothetical protein
MFEFVGGVVDELFAGLDALAAEDLSPLFGPALLERLRPLLAAQNRLAAEVARTVRECEVSGAAEVDGLKTMPSWLRGTRAPVRGPSRAGGPRGRALAHLPALAAAFTAGAVTGEQAGRRRGGWPSPTNLAAGGGAGRGPGRRRRGAHRMWP